MVNSVHMPVSRELMQESQNKHVRQVEHAAKQWEARASKVKNNYERKRWLERQTNANYRNEYDRIRGDLSRYKIPFLTPARLQNRKKRVREPCFFR